MGYTNSYYYWTPSPDTAQAVIDDIELLIANSDTALEVIREPGKIALNGAQQHGADFFEWPKSPVPSWNTAYLDYPEQHWDCCKTSRKKYDKVVFAALLSIKHHLPDAVIHTDDTRKLDTPTGGAQLPPCLGRYHSIVGQIVNMKLNEFGKMHQKGIELYQKTFPDRPIAELLPWQPVI